jgi:hypothetical protein
MDITLVGDTEVDAALREYPKRATKAMVRAMNRAIASGRTVMVKAMAQDTGLKSGDIRKAIVMREATTSNPEARFATSLKRIPLIAFNARQTRSGVSYRMKGSRGKLPHAFIATVRTRGPVELGLTHKGHEGVFVRRGKGRLPIRELWGPSLGHVFGKYRPAGIARVREAFKTNFAHEMGWQARQASAGAD